MKSGRNALCPCGSGKKFKRCCGENEKSQRSSSGSAGKEKREHLQSARQFFEMGNTFSTQGNKQRAILYFEHALSIDPGFVEAYIALANALESVDELDKAVACLERALLIGVSAARVHFNLANVYVSLGEMDRAVTHYEHALTINPDYVEAHNNLGSFTRRSRGLKQAAAHFQRAIAVRPDFMPAHINLAGTLLDQGAAGSAVAQFESMLSRDPNYLAARSGLLNALNYVPGKDPRLIYESHAEFWRRRQTSPEVIVRPASSSKSPDGRLRIGYVSSDFRRHSVAYFVEPVLENHDRAQFDIFCYSNLPLELEDAMTARLQSKSDHWQGIAGRPDADVAEQIRRDQIDILVDLNGHTTHNRLSVFALKPAPVQVTWLGYPNTTGLPAMDYRITDGYADPVGMTEHLHSETLVRLPESFSCYCPPDNAPEASSLPARRNGYLTFGSFNKLAKINHEVIKIWSRLLSAVPDARLYLKTWALTEKSMQDKVLGMFAELGVPADRLMLGGENQSQWDHLAQYGCIDIGLDTFPYNGTTTSCEALWMGVPVITLAGQTHVSRVGVSQMTNLGLTDLVCHSEEEYIAAAVWLSADLEHLETLRQELRSRMRTSPLMDAQRFTRNLEHAYLQMTI